MRVPRSVAWLLLGACFFTAGLLRRFHDQTAQAPHVPPAVGSLLFAAILILFIASLREWRSRPAPGPGIRLGSLTPLMLMLLVEKWVSISLYPTLFGVLASRSLSEAEADALFRLMAGAGLLVLCLLLAPLSAPAARRTWRLARPGRWPVGLAATAVAVGSTYLLLGGLARFLGGDLRIGWPEATRLLVAIAAGQAMLSAAEETYYRGLLLAEAGRLGPRLGLRRRGASRWLALVTTSALFAIEHVTLGPAPAVLRQAVFTFSLGMLLGMLILTTGNLAFAAGLHAWVNGLLLGVAPRFADASGQPSLPAGTYIGLSLMLAFVLAFLMRRRNATTS